MTYLHLKAVLPTLLLFFASEFLSAQTSPTSTQSKNTARVETQSIGTALSQQGGLPLHILYLHGIGAIGGDDSAVLRTSICEYLKKADPTNDCVGVSKSSREYADEGPFANNSSPPILTYLGNALWQSAADWKASRPYVDHWRLKRKTGPPVLVDEINWWPLVLLPKCRTTIVNEASLAGPSAQYLDICAGIKDKFSGSDPPIYPFITPQSAETLKSMHSPSASFNHGLKGDIMDWGFSDAMLAVGPLKDLLIEAIQQLLVKTVISSGEEPPLHPALTETTTEIFQNKPQYIIVSHSLGSYLIFSALNQTENDFPSTISNEQQHSRATIFFYILYETSQVYFLANQVALLELAVLRNTAPTHGQSLFDRWVLAHNGGGNKTTPQIVAWSDPSDLLSWCVPAISQIKVVNIQIKNAIHWFWFIEGPLAAHDNYDKKRKVIQTLFQPLPVSRSTLACPITGGVGPAL